MEKKTIIRLISLFIKNTYKSIEYRMLILVFLLFSTNCILCAGQEISSIYDNFTSSKYGYSITVPRSFQQYTPKQNNIDLAFSDSFGASISVNVTDRQKEEYQITAHDYTKSMLEREIRRVYPNYLVLQTKKIYIDGQNVFLTKSQGEHPKLSSIDVYFYYKDKAFLIKCTAETDKFTKYEELFLAVIKSVKLTK